MKKVIHISNIYPRTGIVQNDIIRRLVLQLAGKEFSQKVLIPVKTVFPARDSKRVAHKDTAVEECYVEIFGLPIGLLLLTRLLLAKPKMNRTLFSFITDSASCVLHAHTTISDGYFAYSFAKATGIPYIVSVSSTDINFQLRYLPWMRPLARRILSNASRVIVITESLGNSLKKRFPDDEYQDRIEVIPFGIEEKHFSNSTHRTRNIPDRLTIVVVATLKHGKNHSSLLKAAKILKEDGLPFNLLFAGDGPLEHQLRKRARKLELEDIVKFLGRISRQEVFELLDHSDVLALPSKKETFGLVYIEALSRGLPIVYSSGTGIDGMVDKDVGIAVNPDKPAEIAAAIQRISNNYALFRRNAVSYSNSRINRFALENIADRYANIYLDILSKRAQ